MILKNFLISCTCFLVFALGLQAQDNYKTVRAAQGDGIYAILRKQGLNPSAYIKEFIEINKDRLRNGDQLIVGREYKIPAKKQDIKVSAGATEEVNKVEEVEEVVEVDEGAENEEKQVTKYMIFGEDEAIVTPKSTRLENTVYYLISGHGGPDPGAMGNYGGTTIAEDEYAYDVTLRLAKELLSHGAKVYVVVRDEDDGIRDQRALELDRDEVVYPDQKIPLGQLERLKQRVDVVNDLYLKHSGRYQRLIVTHVDSRSKDKNIDVFFYYHDKSKNGKRLAESLHKTFMNKYRKFQPNRDYTGTFTDRSNLYMVKNTLPAMAYIEIGNIRNGRDKRRILDPDNRQALAKWISEGILLDYESR